MPDIYLNNLDGIPFGVNAGRPANPQPGQPYFNGEANRLELYTTATGWQNIVQETPAVVNIVGQANQTLPGTVQVNGTNFAAGAAVYAIGTDSVEVQATTTSLVSVVEISATFPPLDPAYEPYDVKVVNPSNLYGILYDAMSVNNAPVWSTPAGSIGTYIQSSPMSFNLSATDATDSTNSTLSYSISSGSLPSGLSLSSNGVISGTPGNVVSDTTTSFSVTVTDGRNAGVSRSFTITISDLAPVWSTGTTLPTFTRNVAYSTTVVATEDDAGEITYSLVSGSLPTGLTLSSAGVISGTPTSALAATFTVRATVTASGKTADRQFNMPNTGPTWSTSSLSSAVQEISYSFQLVATDDSGNSPTYSIASGALPAGFSLSSAGLITGSSASTSSTNITFRATDANGNSADRSLTFNVIVAPTGGTLYQSAGTYSWTAPTNVYRVNVVAVGGGGGGGAGNSGHGGAGGGLGWKNSISVTPGTSYTVVVGGGGGASTNSGSNGSSGGDSYFINTSTVRGAGGQGASANPTETTLTYIAAGGTYVGDGGGTGGTGGYDTQNNGGSGGGGAGGYSGAGGFGAYQGNASGSGSGGGGGGGSQNTDSNGSGGGGGGVGIYGQGANGSGLSRVSTPYGNGGSGGSNGAGFSGSTSPGGDGGAFGGGGGGANQNYAGGNGGRGAVRIIWGSGRSFPSTNVGQNYGGVTETVI